MSTLISPGVATIENDQSQVTSGPIQAGAAIVGPTVKGRVNIPKLVTTYSQYAADFGDTFTSGSDVYSFLTSIAAKNYFDNGGTSLIVTRVQTGSFSSATSSLIETGSGGPTTGLSPFVLETIGEGTIMNSTSPENSKGALDSGSVDNIRWEISNPNTSSGVFSLIIRRGNDTTKKKSIVENFTNLSLDPKASNYIAKVIGDQTMNVRGTGTDVYLQPTGSYPNASRYIRVKSVNYKTPDYLDNSGVAKDTYTGSIPVAGSGSFGDAGGNIIPAGAKFYEEITNGDIQGLSAADYTDAFNLLANKDEFKYNIISAPGLVYANGEHATVLDTLISNVETRGDAIIPLDLTGYGATITDTVTEADSLDTSYAASYWPWVQVSDPGSSQLVWIPPSTLIPGVYANNDRYGEPWFAPAGMTRGGLLGVIQAERKLTQPNRDELYTGKVNPLATFPGRGVVVFGQKTLQQQSTALDRVNVRRLLIELKSYISQVADNLVFEQNTNALRNSFLSTVNPYLSIIQQRQGLYAFKVVMDETNNTADVIDRNELVGGIYLQPTKTAEFIYLNFNILPTGVSFD